PDIDLDIEHDRREEVIQHVYAKYGRTHAAMVANVISYRGRSAVRDVGKALGLPLTTVDRIAKLIGHWGTLSEETLREAGCDPAGRTERMLMVLQAQILRFPRHLSIHPGGFLLGHAPVHDLVPIENGAMADRTVIQWDKDDIEALGLFKVDLLGLGALNQLHRAFDLLAHHRGERWSMATIPANDPPTYAMICRADTLGTFQIESRAQMSMLPRLQPRYFYDLVIQVSIVRPGPIAGGMVHPFLRRRRGQEPVTYPHPALEPVLSKTLGIPLFQEQVMKLAMVAADYTPGEADQLRRDMAAWKKHGNLERHRDKLITRMIAKGIKPEFAERVFEQIKGFGDYGFPEAHGASFALIAYATAWLRCHYPAEFLCSLLNAQPMGFYSAATLIHDAKRRGVEIRPVDVTISDWDCTLEPLGDSPLDGFALRIGLRYVRSLRSDEGERIMEVRARRPFNSIEDFADRTHLAQDSCQTLAEAGAFDAIGPTRRKALWSARGVARTEKPELELQDAESPPEFAELGEHGELAWDYDTQRLSIRGHQLTPLRAALTALGLPTAEQVEALRDGARVRYAGMVLNRQRPHTASGVMFVTLEDETGWVNLVIWPKVYEQHALVARTAKLMGVTGPRAASRGIFARDLVPLFDAVVAGHHRVGDLVHTTNGAGVGRGAHGQSVRAPNHPNTGRLQLGPARLALLAYKVRPPARHRRLKRRAGAERSGYGPVSAIPSDRAVGRDTQRP
ncbi:MAG: helix-hairpin-helix domain-containing protein, partial [Planctomycetota bacterium]